MIPGGAGSPREEAERLVATLLGAASVAIRGAEVRQQLRDLAGMMGAGHVGAYAKAANGPGTGLLSGLSTGAAECCICPLCKVIAALRDPSPEFAERLASGVGDIAVGLTGVLRAFGEALSHPAPTGVTDDPEHDPPSASHQPPAPDGPPVPRKPMAKKTVRSAAAKVSNGKAANPTEPVDDW